MSPRRRWTNRVLNVPAGMLAVSFALGLIFLGIVYTRKWREPVGEPPSAAYADVTFEASERLELAGWYRPAENGAAMIASQGGSSDHDGSVAHASLLARQGYGVLLDASQPRRERRTSDSLGASRRELPTGSQVPASASR